jgi:hypothetical protein
MIPFMATELLKSSSIATYLKFNHWLYFLVIVDYLPHVNHFMLHFLKAATTLLVYALLLPTSAKAQFQLNILGSRLALPQAWTGGLLGGSTTLRYFTSPHAAIGLNARYFADKGSFVFGDVTSSSQVATICLTGQIEYFTAQPQAIFQPYIGLEGGFYTLRYKFVNTGPGTEVNSFLNNFANVGIGPKAGLQCAITPSFGINTEASYQLIFGSRSGGHALFLSLSTFYKFGRRE